MGPAGRRRDGPPAGVPRRRVDRLSHRHRRAHQALAPVRSRAEPDPDRLTALLAGRPHAGDRDARDPRRRLHAVHALQRRQGGHQQGHRHPGRRDRRAGPVHDGRWLAEHPAALGGARQRGAGREGRLPPGLRLPAGPADRLDLRPGAGRQVSRPPRRGHGRGRADLHREAGARAERSPERADADPRARSGRGWDRERRRRPDHGHPGLRRDHDRRARRDPRDHRDRPWRPEALALVAATARDDSDRCRRTCPTRRSRRSRPWPSRGGVAPAAPCEHVRRSPPRSPPTWVPRVRRSLPSGPRIRLPTRGRTRPGCCPGRSPRSW